MKKILSILFLIVTSITLISCGGGGEEGPKAETVKIMHGAVHEIDPFHPNFSGQNKEERQKIQREVEAEMNVKVEYVMYDGDAGWGSARTSAIINAFNRQKPMADIYWTTTNSLSDLALSKAVIPVDKYMNEHGSAIHESVKEIGSYQGQFYGFSQTRPTGQLGLYFNENLLKSKDLENPAEIFARGEWNWSTFEAWMKTAQATMSKEEGTSEYVLGGAYPAWAQSLIPLNNGKLINLQTKQVTFDQKPALDVYDKLINWKENGFFEPNAAYDSGSPEWQGGRVLLHPGTFWFINAENRWGKLKFDLGYVPFPVSDTFKGDYVTPVSGEAVYVLANGIPAEKQELAFKVWNKLQLKKPEAIEKMEFKAVLKSRLREDIYVDAFLEVYNGIYLEAIDDLGIGSYGPTSWRPTIAGAIRGEDGVAGDPRSALASIKPVYVQALKKYFGEE